MILTLYVSWMMVRRLPLLSLVPAVGRVEGRVWREGRRGQARAAVRADGGTARLPTAGTETFSKIIIITPSSLNVIVTLGYNRERRWIFCGFSHEGLRDN